ncbi:hypothetical protein [Catenuloplanes atrovinosus]|uniref:Uncharacterized protein n=1 Tax=Catenuloplanes atrovinosus TaxID=137266 RepID=A0AAE3YS86_9ACTN|nr:hypothetical protein [Catenuloplanes atrovinosus]MDR7277682.1 hypothetical protein [Catenuloplanes atrovinosus]
MLHLVAAMCAWPATLALLGAAHADRSIGCYGDKALTLSGQAWPRTLPVRKALGLLAFAQMSAALYLVLPSAVGMAVIAVGPAGQALDHAEVAAILVLGVEIMLAVTHTIYPANAEMGSGGWRHLRRWASDRNVTMVTLEAISDKGPDGQRALTILLHQVAEEADVRRIAIGVQGVPREMREQYRALGFNRLGRLPWCVRMPRAL